MFQVHLVTVIQLQYNNNEEWKRSKTEQNWLYIELNITKEKVCSSQGSKAFELGATTEQL